jgi:gluconokinase
MGSYVIGIDIGTGSVKAIAMNYQGEVISSAQLPYPTLHPKPGYHEQAPEIIWQAFVKAIFRITEDLKKSPEAVSLSSAMHSVIPVDQQGSALSNMIIWADNRCAAIATKIHQSSSAEMIYEQTGTPIHAMTPLCKIQWIRTFQEELFKKTSKFISIKEYIWYKLFQRFEVDYSIASATGLMDIEKLQWNDNSLDLTSLTVNQLSLLVSPNHRATCQDAELCRQMGVTIDTPFFIGASDGCLANVGSFATEEGIMALTIGTSGAVRIIRKSPMHNFKAMTFNYRLNDTDYVCGGPTNNGGVILKWYAENFLGKKLESANEYALLFNTLTETKPGSDGLIFLPYILGERAPIWNSEACGVFFGMRGYHKQTHFTRAVIEGISLALYHIAHGMIETGLSIKQINVSGGFVHSPQWLQILANIFGTKIALINTADASAIGASYLAMKSLGIIADYAQLKPKAIIEVLPETEFTAVYQNLFIKYRNLYDSIANQMVFDKNLN